MLTLIKKYKLVLCISVLVLFFIVYFYIIKCFYPQVSDRGSFGDMFGGLSAVFSGLALIIVLLELQKSEEALNAQIKAMEKTARLNALNAKLQSLGSSLLSVTIGQYHEAHQRDKINQEMEKIKQEIDKEIQEK